ncbi:hypothetical protein FRUB_08921 [Fimbriiglobus ruber]|uniref:Uncharacterized protein n=1 Tax=Fimbriiglobus ruber TaxID=1908690 RepID=A0A225DCU6_9BACT|nr:hypothetical protein FRUB_08921 [Fimbriiglobus ruber]
MAFGVPIPFLDSPQGLPVPLPVPDGDQEMAWLHTSTSGMTWERFVCGVERAQTAIPGLRVDDSGAFVDQTTTAPEVVVSMDGRPGKLRIRWYKLTAGASTAHWVKALAKRETPPLALIGGGSSDRVVDLARALEAQTEWHGDRPLLLITTATADEVLADTDDGGDDLRPRTKNLLDVYDDRSFRFCFTNRQMAESVLDFVWANPALRPQIASDVAPLAICSAAAAARPIRTSLAPPPQHVFGVFWQDDPYSTDLYWQFRQALSKQLGPPGTNPMRVINESPVEFSSWELRYSVGGFSRPNLYEAQAVESLLHELNKLPPQRSLLVLPTVTQPARRFLRALTDAAPRIGNRLVAVTGDGIPVNAIYRDGEFAWPVRELSVPLVLFTHNSPVGWDGPNKAPPPPGYELYPPNSTEEVLHFSRLTRVVAEACYPRPGDGPEVPTRDGLVSRANDLAARFHGRTVPFFDANGDRLSGTNEYIVVVWPQVEDEAGAPGRPDATMEVYRRGVDHLWQHVKTVEILPRRQTSANPADPARPPRTTAPATLPRGRRG